MLHYRGDDDSPAPLMVLYSFIFFYIQVHWLQFALGYSTCSWKYHLEFGAVDLCCGLGIPGMSGFPKLPVLGARAACDMLNMLVFAAGAAMGL